MVRIITGSARSITLSVPQSARPISDRAKSSLFAVIGSDIIGKRILDLYAGSGSLGIEALSRGAASCTFIDSDRYAIEDIKENLLKSKLSQSATVSMQKVLPYVSNLPENSFDIVFADPPYDFYKESRHRSETLLSLLAEIIPDGGAIVLKHPPRISLPDIPHLVLADSRTFGDSSVTLWVRMPKSRNEKVISGAGKAS